MARLIYSSIVSLDGFVADAEGNFDWAEPDEEVHRFVNELERPIGTYLYGRRMYEVMSYWETAHTIADQPDFAREYADIWQAADKVVFSSSLPTTTTARTELRPGFDPDSIRELKSSASHDLSIGGPGLAAAALRSDLVDELQLFLSPVVVGAGNPALPAGLRLTLDLLAERRFANGVVFLRYHVAAS